MKHDLFISSFSLIRKEGITLNNTFLPANGSFTSVADFAKSIYRQNEMSYPKFFKMDTLSKLGFLSAELLLKEKTAMETWDKTRVGVIAANSTSSLDTDIAHQKTISDRNAYFPSPAVFVYTLPNILLGEICIRHKFQGENAFFVCKTLDPFLLVDYVTILFNEMRVEAVLAGWADVLADKFESLFYLVEKKDEQNLQEVPFHREHSVETLMHLYHNTHK